MTKPHHLALVLACALGLTFQVHADPLGTGFTYQGQLTSDTTPASGDYDFKFVLYGALERGAGLATNIIRPLGVTNGYFAATLDFGADAFDGTARWLEISVRPYSGVLRQPAYTLLTPRQALTAVPYALVAKTVATDTPLFLDGTVVFNPADKSMPPFMVATSNLVPSLNANFLEGREASSFVAKAGDNLTGPLRVEADYANAPEKPQLELSDSKANGVARVRLSLGAKPFWDIATRTGGDGNALRFYSSEAGADLLTLRANGSLTVPGETTVKVLNVVGGADVAEPFRMANPAIPQGAVVIIDEEHLGQLKLSERAYDTRVAGIVSGANGVNPGISLSQQGLLEGGRNVALSGRVYVQADATPGAIKPGDLLTTAAVPGYARKVTDPTQAQGAILGKAMSPLSEGKGMVLVLVTLQ